MAEIPFILAFSLYNRLTSVVLLMQSYNCPWGGWWFLDHFIFMLRWFSNAFFYASLAALLGYSFVYLQANKCNRSSGKLSGVFSIISKPSLLWL